MRKVSVLLMVVAACVVLPRLAQAQVAQYYENGKSIYVYNDEWDGDESTTEVAVRFVNWRKGFEEWAYGRINPDAGSAELWDPEVGWPTVSGKSVTGPRQRYYGGVDCWDTPGQNRRFGNIVLDGFRGATNALAGGAPTCFGAGGDWATCVGRPLISALWGPMLVDSAGYLWTCFML